MAATTLTEQMRTRRPGALLLLAICFGISGLLRLGALAPAIASEVAGLSDNAASVAEPATCVEAEPNALLAAIRQRQDQLQQQELAFAERRQVLTIAEAKIAEQMEGLRQAEEKLAATLAIADEASEKDLARLTAVYENMKPKNASELFAAMDTQFAAGFLSRMRPDAAAAVMAGLPAESAYAISLTMAGRNALAPRD